MGCPLCLGTALSVFPGNALRFCSQSHMLGLVSSTLDSFWDLGKRTTERLLLKSVEYIHSYLVS